MMTRHVSHSVRRDAVSFGRPLAQRLNAGKYCRVIRHSGIYFWILQILAISINSGLL
jgi:hypothetical protein